MVSVDVAPVDQPTTSDPEVGLRIAALFAGIGGIEQGLTLAGHHTATFCEVEQAAIDVLRDRFDADVPLVEDVADLDSLGDVGIVAVGFPCQDLSQAGRTAGIGGGRSGLVDHVFRLLKDRADDPPRWLLLENVPFMLQLDGGRAMYRLTEGLAELGYRWAYRVVDARAFGRPQRRRRVLMLASATHDPRGPLLMEDAGEPEPAAIGGRPCGFYWTEGIRGLGLAIDCVPTLKGGSTIGIPSPPGIWIPGEGIFTPDIRDAERLQGFDADWAQAADAPGRRSGVRWKLVGNAVSVPLAQWLGNRLHDDHVYVDAADTELAVSDRWPYAAWGDASGRRRAPVSAWPRHTDTPGLLEFLEYPLRPLSERATAGFLRRARSSRLRFPDGFIADVAEHLRASAGA